MVLPKIIRGRARLFAVICLWLFLVVCLAGVYAAEKPRFLLLPLISRDETSQAYCDKVTADLSDGLEKLNLMRLRVAPNLLGELKLTEYSAYNEVLHKRISSLGESDYVIWGYVLTEKGTGNYTLYVSIFRLTDNAFVYGAGYFGLKDMQALINGQINNIKNLPLFMADAPARRQKITGILKTYSPETFPVIDYILTHKHTFDILHYIHNTESVDDLNTTVHEASHAYAASAINQNAMTLFISPDDTARIVYTKTFPSKEIVPDIPEKLRISRFNTYIAAPVSPTSTQYFGVYGLLDELNAYYQGTAVVCDLFDYYAKTYFRKDRGPYFDYLSGIYSTYFAYYEFKYYIYTYLLYAARKHPRVYVGIIGNKEFIRALQKVLRRFAALVQKVPEIENRLDTLMREKGLSLQRTGKYTYIKNSSGERTGRSNNFQFITPLFEELKKPKYRKLERELFGTELPE